MRKRAMAWVLCVLVLLGSVASAEGSWRNILILGDDTRDWPKFERSDTMIIVSINEEKGKVKLTSIMRDSDVSFANGGGGKINGAMAVGGPENIVATINKNFGTDITDYVVVNFKQFHDIIELIGGVNIEVSAKEGNYINNFEYFKYFYKEGTPDLEGDGMKKLIGWQALIYVRDRKSTSGGDYDRVKRQRKMMIALLKEMQSRPLEETLELAEEIVGLVSTNLSAEELIELGKFALTVDPATIEEFRIPADGTFQDGKFNGVWKIKINVEKNRNLLQDFIYGFELKSGSCGENVKKLQQKLVDMGLLNDKVDGIFGGKTAAAVSAAQKQLGWEQTGTASEEFLEALYAK